jgi:hypothetical protein
MGLERAADFFAGQAREFKVKYDDARRLFLEALKACNAVGGKPDLQPVRFKQTLQSPLHSGAVFNY